MNTAVSVALLGALARLPPALVLALGRLLAWPLALLARGRRRIVRANLALCLAELDERERGTLMQRNMRSTALSLFENLLAWHAPSLGHVDDGRYRLLLDGAEHLERALQAGRGAILVSPHFTMIEMIPRALADPEVSRASSLQPRQVVQIVRRQGDPALEAFVDAGRRRWGPTLDKKDVRGMLKALRRNEVLIYAPDQNFSYGTVFVPFFGVEAATTSGTSRLARSAGCPVLPCFVRRSGRGWSVRIDPPLEDFPSASDEADAGRLNALIESEIRAVPEQYLWAHRRFRSRPPGAPPLYPPEVLKAQHRPRD
jgi:KDO2-lipid IV(A) lauroyltransferase